MGTELIKNGIKAIRYSEEVHFPADWTFYSHAHDCYHMFCVLTDALELIVDGQKFFCPANSALIIPPGVYHKKELRNNGTPVVLEIMFELDDPDLEEDLRRKGIQVELDAFCLECFKNVEVFANSRQNKLRSRAYRYLDAALTHLCTGEEDKDPYTLNAQFIDMEGFSEVTKAVIIYIDAHYKEQFTLDDMGKDLGYNKSYLCTVFKRETASTINDYLNLVRISHFAEFYTFVDRDISYICRQCGFTSASHFNRTFKKFLGTTPSQYKQVRYPHFNADALVSGMKNTEDSYKKLKGVLERMVAPATHIDVPYFTQESETTR
jgi:AraC-like DNA-binding protein